MYTSLNPTVISSTLSPMNKVHRIEIKLETLDGKGLGRSKDGHLQTRMARRRASIVVCRLRDRLVPPPLLSSEVPFRRSPSGLKQPTKRVNNRRSKLVGSLPETKHTSMKNTLKGIDSAVKDKKPTMPSRRGSGSGLH